MSEERAPYGADVLARRPTIVHEMLYRPNDDGTLNTNPVARVQIRKILDAEAASLREDEVSGQDGFNHMVDPSTLRAHLCAFMDALDRAEDTITELMVDHSMAFPLDLKAAEHKMIRQRDAARRLNAAHERLLRRHREKIRDFEALRGAVLGVEFGEDMTTLDQLHTHPIDRVKAYAVKLGLPEKALQRRPQRTA